MARIRTVKPEFWTDDRVGECSPTTRLLFLATWNFADDHGNLERSSKQLKAQAFPYDPIDCEPLLQELMLVGLLIEYEAGGKKYLHIKGFDVHQKIEKKGKPRHPLYEESLRIRGGVGEPSPGSCGLFSGREGKGSRKGSVGGESARTARSPTATRLPDDFELTESRRTAARAEGVDPDREFARFRDYWRAASGANSRKHDWEATWRNWCRKAADIGAAGGTPAGKPYKASPTTEELEERERLSHAGR